jgi:rabenosyn-5
MSLVQWIPDGDVNLCPTCARTFGIMHRKHHCRLCGAIMCNKCSQFLTYTAASKIFSRTIRLSS